MNEKRSEWMKRSHLNGFVLLWFLKIVVIDTACYFFLLRGKTRPASKFIRVLDQKQPVFDLSVIWPQLVVTTQLSRVISYHSHLLLHLDLLGGAQYKWIFKFQCLRPGRFLLLILIVHTQIKLLRERAPLTGSCFSPCFYGLSIQFYYI